MGETVRTVAVDGVRLSEAQIREAMRALEMREDRREGCFMADQDSFEVRCAVFIERLTALSRELGVAIRPGDDALPYLSDVLGDEGGNYAYYDGPWDGLVWSSTPPPAGAVRSQVGA